MKSIVFGLALISVLCAGCGVKGRPLPPLEPVQPSDGRLLYEKTEEAKKKRQQP